jgi:hypothetical protein
MSRGCNKLEDSIRVTVLEVVNTLMAKAPTICSAPKRVKRIPRMLMVIPTLILLRSMLAVLILEVGFFIRRRDNRRVAHVQKMEPKEKAIPVPAKRKFGKLLAWAMDEFDPLITFRANNNVMEDTVVRMSCAHHAAQESRRNKSDVSFTRGSTLTLMADFSSASCFGSENLAVALEGASYLGKKGPALDVTGFDTTERD